VTVIVNTAEKHCGDLSMNVIYGQVMVRDMVESGTGLGLMF